MERGSRRSCFQNELGLLDLESVGLVYADLRLDLSHRLAVVYVNVTCLGRLSLSSSRLAWVPLAAGLWFAWGRRLWAVRMPLKRRPTGRL